MMRRNLGFVVLLTMVLFLFSSLQYILLLYQRDVMLETIMDRLFGQSMLHTGVSMVLFTGTMLLAPVIVGIAQFAYMHSKKSVDVYHSLPVTRSQLMLCNLAAAFTTVMVPAVLNFSIMAAAGAFRSTTTLYHLEPLGILGELCTWAVTVLVILAAIMFVSTLVGSTFDTLIFSMELLLAPLALVFSCLLLFETLLLGFSMDHLNLFYLIILSPFSTAILRQCFGWDSIYSMRRAGLTEAMVDSRWQVTAEEISGLRISAVGVVVWLVLGVVLIWAACRLYRTRKSEMAEQSSSQSILAQLGKLIAVFLGGTLGGLALCAILGVSNVWLYVLWTILCGAVTYTLLEAMLLRGFRGFKRGLPAGAVLLAITALFSAVLITGGLGYEKRTPAPDTVQSVTLGTRGRYETMTSLLDASSKRTAYYSESYQQEARLRGEILSPFDYDTVDSVTLTSDEALALVEKLHQAITRQPRRIFGAGSGDEMTYYVPMELSYELKNGTTFRRDYYQMKGEILDLIIQLENTQEFKTKTNPIFGAVAEDFASAQLQGTLSGAGKAITSQQDLARLIEALQADSMEEDLTGIGAGTVQDVGFLQLNLKQSAWDQDLAENKYTEYQVMVTSDFHRTLALLKELGADSGTGTIVRAVVQGDSWYRTNSAIHILQDARTAGMVEEYNKKYGDQREYAIAAQDPTVTDYDSENATTQLITDPQLLSQLKAKGRLQFHQADLNVTVIFQDKDGNAVAMRAVACKDLPQAIYDKLPSWTKESYEVATTTTQIVVPQPVPTQAP